MNKHDIERERRLKALIDLIKMVDAPLGDEFERVYTDPIATAAEKDKFISIVSRPLHGLTLSKEEIKQLADVTSEIMTTRIILDKMFGK